MVDLAGIGDTVTSFIEQSKRVISITYKPRPMEFRQMAIITALGMVLLGLMGFVLTLVSYLYK